MCLCELYITMDIRRATKDSIAKADVDIIGESSVIQSSSSVQSGTAR